MATKTTVPSFGISSGKRSSVHTPRQPEQPQAVQSGVNNGSEQVTQKIQMTADICLPIQKISIGDKVPAPGKIVLNPTDGLIYYSTGEEWVPIPVSGGGSGDGLAFEKYENSEKTIPKHGDELVLSSKSGYLTDGSVKFQVAGDQAVEIKRAGSGLTFDLSANLVCKKTTDTVHTITTTETVQVPLPAELVLAKPEQDNVQAKLGLVGAKPRLNDVSAQLRLVNVESCDDVQEPAEPVQVLPTAEPPPEEPKKIQTIQKVTTQIPAVTMTGSFMKLTVKCSITSNSPMFAQINNTLITIDSIVTVTIQTEDGLPNSWINKLENGAVTIGFSVTLGKPDIVTLHVSVV